MKSGIDTLDQFQALLHNQNYHLAQVDDNGICIKGIAKINTFVMVLLSVCGAVLVILGFVSLIMEQPEILGGIVFLLIGILLILIPFYNYYSKKNFRIFLDKTAKKIELSPANILAKKRNYSFGDVSKLYLKQKKVNTFVDNTTPSSYVTYFSIGLQMSDGNDPALLHFSCQTQDIEDIINQFSNKISSFLEVEKEVIEN
jgi:hypothetical protein